MTASRNPRATKMTSDQMERDMEWKGSPLPWRRGIGNECHTIFDDQGSVVADRVGTRDGTIIADAVNALAAAPASEGRNAAIEEAAKVAEKYTAFSNSISTTREAWQQDAGPAAAIRALKRPPLPVQGEDE